MIVCPTPPAAGRPLPRAASVTRGWASSASCTAAEKPCRSTASAPPAGSLWVSAARMISEPARRISSWITPTALFCGIVGAEGIGADQLGQSIGRGAPRSRAPAASRATPPARPPARAAMPLRCRRARRPRYERCCLTPCSPTSNRSLYSDDIPWRPNDDHQAYHNPKSVSLSGKYSLGAEVPAGRAHAPRVGPGRRRFGAASCSRASRSRRSRSGRISARS